MDNLIFERGYVTYEDFGAVGDGKTNDFKAIYDAHEYANVQGLPVKASAEKTYYISDTRLDGEVFTVKIRTNVDWCGANFIIDDSNLTVMRDYPEERKMASRPVFEVLPDDEHKMFKIEDRELLDRIAKAGLNAKTKKIDLGIDWDGPVMIVPYSTYHKVFKRAGTTQHDGSAMHELIVLDKDGNVDPDTPIMFAYSTLDYIEVYKLDPKSAITIENGTFTTLESRINHFHKDEEGVYQLVYHGYVSRGMNVRRSYTTVRNIEHRVSGGFTLLDRAYKNLEGAMYGAFFNAVCANEITFKDCTIPGRTSYGDKNGHSSYGFGANCVNKIVLDGCVQPNFWVTVDPVTFEIKNATVRDSSCIGNARRLPGSTSVGEGFADVNGIKRRLCWGIGGTNFCKNMEYLNSTLTRYDAHNGLYNGKIVNCNVSGLELTGVGELLIENTNWHQYTENIPLLYMRGDYGYHWDGEIILRNVNAYMMNRESIQISQHNHRNWYFGYTTVFPSITVDNMRFYDGESWEQLPTGYKANLFVFREAGAKMHLPESNVPSMFCVVDEDGDGFVDEPRFIDMETGELSPVCDLDGDGKMGNTSLVYEECLKIENYLHGVPHPTCKANLNLTKPPKHIKVLNNKNENGETVCYYTVVDTSGKGVSDGGWYRPEGSPDTMGGFFGGTEFFYGEGESFVGTENKDGITDTFVFKKEFYE